jgi:hypothetical protein
MMDEEEKKAYEVIRKDMDKLIEKLDEVKYWWVDPDVQKELMERHLKISKLLPRVGYVPPTYRLNIPSSPGVQDINLVFKELIEFLNGLDYKNLGMKKRVKIVIDNSRAGYFLERIQGYLNGFLTELQNEGWRNQSYLYDHMVMRMMGDIFYEKGSASESSDAEPD